MPAAKLTPAQLRVLKLVVAGEVVQELIDFSWRVECDGESVTATAWALMRRGLVEERSVGADPRRAVLTAAGRALLESLNPEGH